MDRTPFRIGAETLGLAAATVYLFNPGVIFDSAVWGQIDSVGTLVLLAHDLRARRAAGPRPPRSGRCSRCS